MRQITINGITFYYVSDRGLSINVYDEDKNLIGTWDDIQDLRYDVEHDPDQFKK